MINQLHTCNGSHPGFRLALAQKTCIRGLMPKLALNQGKDEAKIQFCFISFIQPKQSI